MIQEDYEHALGLARRQGYEQAKREFQAVLIAAILKAGSTIKLTHLNIVNVDQYTLHRTDEVDGCVTFHVTGNKAPIAAAPPPSPVEAQPEPSHAHSDWIGRMEDAAMRYAAEYEHGEARQPTKDERAYIEDAIAGLLADDDFMAVVRSAPPSPRELVEALRRAIRHIEDWWRPDGSLPPAGSPQLVEDLCELLAKVEGRT